MIADGDDFCLLSEYRFLSILAAEGFARAFVVLNQGKLASRIIKRSFID